MNRLRPTRRHEPPFWHGLNSHSWFDNENEEDDDDDGDEAVKENEDEVNREAPPLVDGTMEGVGWGVLRKVSVGGGGVVTKV